MPHCYAHPTLYSTQQLVVPVKLTFYKETGILKRRTHLHMWQCQDLMIETDKWNGCTAAIGRWDLKKVGQ